MRELVSLKTDDCVADIARGEEQVLGFVCQIT